MKRKTAKEILVESFREIAETKSIDRITIRDITENCGYSSATFYRQFKDKYDLIAWDYSRKLKEIMSQINEPDHSWSRTLLDAAEYFQEQKQYLENLFLHTSGLDAFIAYMREVNYVSLRDMILKETGDEELDEMTEIYIRVYVLGTVQLTSEWVLGRYGISPEELAQVYKDTLPEPLHKYLL